MRSLRLEILANILKKEKEIGVDSDEKFRMYKIASILFKTPFSYRI